MRPDSAITIDPQAGEILAIAGGSYRIVLSGEQTGGAFAVIEMQVPPNGGPGPHAHAAIQESFYVLEGEVVFKTETQSYTATKGASITIPQGGAVHCFKNESDAPARLLCTVVPAGLDAFFREAAQLVPTAPDMKERVQELATKYGQELFPPDYFNQ